MRLAGDVALPKRAKDVDYGLDNDDYDNDEGEEETGDHDRTKQHDDWKRELDEAMRSDSSGGEEEDQREIDEMELLRSIRVKLDALHAMMRFKRTLRKSHGAYQSALSVQTTRRILCCKRERH